MHHLNQYKSRFAGLFLAGYLALLVYSVLHFHYIDFNNIHSIAGSSEHSSNIPAGDSVANLFLTCQFSNLYNTPYFNDYKELPELELKNPQTVIVTDTPASPLTCSSENIHLRAPPAFSC